MRHRLLKIITVLILSAFLLPPFEIVKATNVSGNISGNTTWNFAGSPYILTGNVTVTTGVTLTIDTSGGAVDVKANGNYSLTINSGATLSAVATAGKPGNYLLR